MRIISAHKSDIGQVYQHNDDYIWVDNASGFYILADGMGGQEAGDVASHMTAHSVGQAIVAQLTDGQPLPDAAQVKAMLVDAIEAANRAVYQAAQQAQQKRRMGTTIVAALLRSGRLFVSHAGDSRAYLVRNNEVKQLTEDDSWGAQFAAAGVKNKNNEKGKFDHFLTKAVGQEHRLDPSFVALELRPDDWLLLCSDGLWNMVEDAQILEILNTANPNPQQAVDALVSAANEAGGKDNISVIAIKLLD
jgi:protein phosphatase